MTEVTLSGRRGSMTAYVATPATAGPWPGVVVVHDAFGVSRVMRGHADWLAEHGFLAILPDLYYWGRKITCMFAFLRDADRALGDLDVARDWLVAQPGCTGRVGVIGFCMGGGFAVSLAPGHGYAASSVNYGSLSRQTEQRLSESCPIVGSFGGRDRGTRSVPGRITAALDAAGIDHDVKVYPDAGHSFLDDYRPEESPTVMRPLSALMHAGYHEVSAVDARDRIVAFFDRHLRQPPAGG